MVNISVEVHALREQRLAETFFARPGDFRPVAMRARRTGERCTALIRTRSMIQGRSGRAEPVCLAAPAALPETA